MDATTTICHRYTPPEQLRHFASTADILVTATGIPKLITEDMIKPGACVIDVGITRITDPDTKKTKLVGDVDFESKEKEEALSHFRNILNLIFFYRCEGSSRIYHSSTWRCWTYDSNHAHEKYDISC